VIVTNGDCSKRIRDDPRYKFFKTIQLERIKMSSTAISSDTTFAPYELSKVPTPAFLVHLSKLRRNCMQMIERAKKRNVQLRPHMKVMIDGNVVSDDDGDAVISTFCSF
jgi:hypothetical protein